MSICGIVCEYNPLHLGHKYQIESLKKEGSVDKVIAVMSGNFVQRGEAAIVDKWTRAEMALEAGCDLVVELPLVAAISSADDFGLGALKVLSLLGADSLSFGMELEDVKKLEEYASRLKTEDYEAELKWLLTQGYSYSQASNMALIKNGEELGSNTILGLAYIRAMDTLGLDLKLFPITRRGSAYRDFDCYQPFASALAIRTALFRKIIDWKQVEVSMPREAFKLLYERHKYVHADDLSSLLLSRIYRLKPEGLKAIRGVTEGLEHRIYDIAMTNPNYSDFASEVSTKRYTEASIKRVFLNIIFGIEKGSLLETIRALDYVRVLGFNDRGRAHLAGLRAKNEVKLIQNLARDMKKLRPKSPLLAYDIEASSIYSLVYEHINANSDYKLGPVIKSGA